MYTRRRQPTRASLEEDDEDGVIPETAPGKAAPEKDREGFEPAEQHRERDLVMPPAAGRDRQAHGQRLADLLSAAAVLVGEMDEPVERVGGPELQDEDSATAMSHVQETREVRETQPA
ncbi:unnamed protein product [Lampetra fluviatilis]